MFIENLKMALKALKSNKMRSGLTILGIVIGIAAVIALLSVGKGAQLSVTSSIEKMGTNLLTVRSGLARRGIVQLSQTKSLDNDDAKLLSEKLKKYALIAYDVSARAQAKYSFKNTNTTVTGITPSYFEVRNYKIELGRMFRENAIIGNQKVCIIGKTVKNELGLDEPIGQKLRINRLQFTIIGTYEPRGDSGFSDEDNQIFIPITTAQKRIIGNNNVRSVYISVIEKKDVDKVESLITKILRKAHRIPLDKENDFSIRSQLDLLQTVQDVSKSFTFLLGSIAFISLIVGGVGIMNILLVSVTERTKEIGIRKAIGAYESDILNQFLIEAVVLCIIGGIIGSVVGIIAAKIISIFSKWPFVIQPLTVLFAFGIALAIGIFFGYYPARKAAKLNPVDALHYE